MIIIIRFIYHSLSLLLNVEAGTICVAALRAAALRGTRLCEGNGWRDASSRAPFAMPTVGLSTVVLDDAFPFLFLGLTRGLARRAPPSASRRLLERRCKALGVHPIRTAVSFGPA